MPILVADCIAILSCSLINFCLGDRWDISRDFRVAFSLLQSPNPR